MKTIKVSALILLFTILAIFCSPNHSWSQNIATENLATDNMDDDFTLDDDWDVYDEAQVVNDPLDGYNKFMFKVNDKIYKYLFNPISTGYNYIVPKRIQKCFNNLFTNSKATIPFFNNIFQGKYKHASVVFGRFVVNSTVGIGGLFDPAESMLKWSKHNEDFGQTLGHHGFGSGPYIVIPIIGPSTGRDFIGYVGDRLLNPFTWIGIYDVSPSEVFDHLPYLKRVNIYSYVARDAYDEIMEGAIDPYVALQNSYVQYREQKIKE